VGLGKLSKSTASRICSELRERFEAFKRRDLYEVHLAAKWSCAPMEDGRELSWPHAW
jgi:hypothetical protein